MNKTTILKDDPYKYGITGKAVRYRHVHEGNPFFKEFNVHEQAAWDGTQIPNNIKGYTQCILLTEKDIPDIIAYAYCSGKDQYNKAIGRKISHGRAIKLAEESGIL